jgi:hypothetical protein
MHKSDPENLDLAHRAAIQTVPPRTAWSAANRSSGSARSADRSLLIRNLVTVAVIAEYRPIPRIIRTAVANRPSSVTG